MTWYDFVFDNAYQVDSAEAETKLREKYPDLLHEKERIELAFQDRGGKGRDKEYFTTHRILIKDGKGVVNSKRKNYTSIFYSKVQAWTVETVGAFLDGDAELEVWTSGVRRRKISFATANLDIFQLQQLMNHKVIGAKLAQTPPDNDAQAAPIGKKHQGTATKIIDWFSDNAREINAQDVENRLKQEMPILLQTEKVQAAFKKSARDTICFTNHRILLIDVQGLLGKEIEFASILWESVHAFSIKTAGKFLDLDTELTIHTNITKSKWVEIRQDFRVGKADIFQVHKVVASHVLLGEDQSPIAGIDPNQGLVDMKGDWWFRDNQRPLDAIEMNRVYHTAPPLLQDSEQVEMAFKGRRDITLFTTKRLIIIDPRGIYGKAIKFTSVPWERIIGFGIQTAGKYLDYDTECMFYTEMRFIPGDSDNPDDPYMSCLSVDFNKKLVDLAKIKYYLSRRLLKEVNGARTIPMDRPLTNHFDRPDGAERLFQWLGSDTREIDPKQMDQHLHTTMPILLEEERTLMAYKAGRDVAIFTNLRFMEIDVKGLFGKKIEYISIPYKSIRSFAVESAGTWDRDNEVKIYTRNLWTLGKTNIDFRTGKADVMMIQKFLSALLVGSHEDPKVDFGPKRYKNDTEAKSLGGSSLRAAFLQSAKEIKADKVDEMFKISPPLLLETEQVLYAFQQGRDVYAFSDRRLIVSDTKGLSGKRVKYKTIPYQYVHGFETETPGSILDDDSELYLHTDIPSVGVFELCIKKKTTNIYKMHRFCGDIILFGETFEKDTVEPEPFFDENDPWSISF